MEAGPPQLIEESTASGSKKFRSHDAPILFLLGSFGQEAGRLYDSLIASNLLFQQLNHESKAGMEVLVQCALTSVK